MSDDPEGDARAITGLALRALGTNPETDDAHLARVLVLVAGKIGHHLGVEFGEAFCGTVQAALDAARDGFRSGAAEHRSHAGAQREH